MFRNFVVSVPAGATRFVRGMQFRPGNRAVHHANIRVDATAASRRLDEADPQPGYEGIIARSADFPDGQFLGLDPGPDCARAVGRRRSWQLRGGSDLVVQLHLRPTGATEDIAPMIGLYFGDRAPASTPTMLRLGRQDLDVPAGAAAHRGHRFIRAAGGRRRACDPAACALPRAVDGGVGHAARWLASPAAAHRRLGHQLAGSLCLPAPVPLPAGTRLSMTLRVRQSDRQSSQSRSAAGAGPLGLALER